MTLTTQSFSNLKEAWLGKAGQKVTLETGFIRLHPASSGFMWLHVGSPVLRSFRSCAFRDS